MTTTPLHSAALSCDNGLMCPYRFAILTAVLGLHPMMSLTTLNGTLAKQEKELIEAALAASRGRISGPTGAATKLGLPSRTLDSKIKRLKINVYRFKTSC